MDKNLSKIIKYLNKHYGNQVTIDDYMDICDKFKICKKEQIEIYTYLINENIISNRQDGTFIPLRNVKVLNTNLKLSFIDKYLFPFILCVLSFVLGLVIR